MHSYIYQVSIVSLDEEECVTVDSIVDNSAFFGPVADHVAETNRLEAIDELKRVFADIASFGTDEGGVFFELDSDCVEKYFKKRIEKANAIIAEGPIDIQKYFELRENIKENRFSNYFYVNGCLITEDSFLEYYGKNKNRWYVGEVLNYHA